MYKRNWMWWVQHSDSSDSDVSGCYILSKLQERIFKQSNKRFGEQSSYTTVNIMYNKIPDTFCYWYWRSLAFILLLLSIPSLLAMPIGCHKAKGFYFLPLHWLPLETKPFLQWQSRTEVAGPTVTWFRSGQGTHTETSPGTSPNEYVPFGQTGNRTLLRYSMRQQICMPIYRFSKHCCSNNSGMDWLPLWTHVKLKCSLATIFQSCTTRCSEVTSCLCEYDRVSRHKTAFPQWLWVAANAAIISVNS
jgi:hypothetical protein